MMEIFTYMDNTITLKPLMDPIFEIGKDNFEITSQKLQDSALENVGIQDAQILKSLGLFAVALALITVGVVIYYLMRTCKGAVC